MSAEEILAKLAEAEGLYIEVGDWVVGQGEGEYAWVAGRYKNGGLDLEKYFDSLPEALEHTLK